MAITAHDGTPISTTEANALRSRIAYDILRETATTWGGITTYGQLAAEIETRSGIADTQRRQWWISAVLDGAAKLAVEQDEPPVTALCVNAQGKIGDGYLHAPKIPSASTSPDAELSAAEDRLLCYERFAAPSEAPARRHAVLPPSVQLERRADSWLEDLIQVGRLSVADEIPFLRHIEVARLFGFTHKGHQRATIALDSSTVIWFPKMYSNSDWANELESGGTVIRMAAIPGGNYSATDKDREARRDVIAFGHVDEMRARFYKFLGVFELDTEASTNDEWVHRLVSDTVYFDGGGRSSFNDVVKRGSQDDQFAEAADIDPQLVEEFAAEIVAGDYGVEDRVASTKTRGSAQRAFADRVKSNYRHECAVTGIKTREFLVASHIVPWSEDPQIRKDPTNGICLSTFVDRAFDTGFIWIDALAVVHVRWERVGDDSILKVELRKIDGVPLSQPTREAPDPDKLARRLALDY